MKIDPRSRSLQRAYDSLFVWEVQSGPDSNRPLTIASYAHDPPHMAAVVPEDRRLTALEQSNVEEPKGKDGNKQGRGQCLAVGIKPRPPTGACVPTENKVCVNKTRQAVT